MRAIPAGGGETSYPGVIVAVAAAGDKYDVQFDDEQQVDKGVPTHDIFTAAQGRRRRDGRSAAQQKQDRSDTDSFMEKRGGLSRGTQVAYAQLIGSAGPGKLCVRMLMDEGDKPRQRAHRVYRVVPNLPEMVVDEGSVLFGMTGLEVEKPIAGFSLPMEFRTESSARALVFTQQREASVTTTDS